MKIVTYGNKEKEKILLLHPMFTSAKFFDFVIDRLSNKYYLIIPTYSGHYENSDYVSMEDEEKTIDEFLKENNIDKLKAIILIQIKILLKNIFIIDIKNVCLI